MFRTTRNAIIAATAIISTGIAAHAQVVDYSNGFPSTAPLKISQTNPVGNLWNPLPGGSLVLTPGTDATTPDQSIATCSLDAVETKAFFSTFTFRLQSRSGQSGNGFTFLIRGPWAVYNTSEYMPIGFAGDGLGSMGIGNGVAIKFDTHKNGKDPAISTTGLFVKGVSPDGGVSTGAVNLSSGHTMRANITYLNNLLRIGIIDLETQATFTRTYTVDIPATVGAYAFVGFTGSSNVSGNRQEILNWYHESYPTPSMRLNQNLVPGGWSGISGWVSLSTQLPKDAQIRFTNTNPAASAPSPSSTTIAAGAWYRNFYLATVPVSDLTSGRIQAEIVQTTPLGDTYSQTVSAPFSIRPPKLLYVFTPSYSMIPEGGNPLIYLSLDGPVASKPIIVNLASNNPSVVGVPPTIIFPAGASGWMDIPVATGGVNANTVVQITGSGDGVSKTSVMTVRPLRPTGLTVSTATVKGGSSVEGTVQIESPAPVGGRVVTLSSNNAAASVPVTVTVPAGQTSQTFTITTKAVTANANVKLSAGIGAANVYVALAVTK